MKQLQRQRGKMERIIIFCKKYSELVFIGILKDLWASALLNEKELLTCLDIGWSKCILGVHNRSVNDMIVENLPGHQTCE